MTPDAQEGREGSPIENKLAELREGPFREQLTRGDINDIAALLLSMLRTEPEQGGGTGE